MDVSVIAENVLPTLYALVNGEVVTGNTPDELVDNIYQYLDENPMF